MSLGAQVIRSRSLYIYLQHPAVANMIRYVPCMPLGLFRPACFVIFYIPPVTNTSIRHVHIHIHMSYTALPSAPMDIDEDTLHTD